MRGGAVAELAELAEFLEENLSVAEALVGPLSLLPPPSPHHSPPCLTRYGVSSTLGLGLQDRVQTERQLRSTLRDFRAELNHGLFIYTTCIMYVPKICTLSFFACFDRRNTPVVKRTPAMVNRRCLTNVPTCPYSSSISYGSPRSTRAKIILYISENRPSS